MKNMKLIIVGGLLVFLLVIAACTKNEEEKVKVNVINATEAKELIDENENEVIIDVRTREEFNEKHIKDAVSIPVSTIEENIENVASSKDTLILLYCKSGKRAEEAAKTLIRLGYTNVHSFGSIDNWEYDIVE